MMSFGLKGGMDAALVCLSVFSFMCLSVFSFFHRTVWHTGACLFFLCFFLTKHLSAHDT